MHSRSILRSIPCDLKQLPIGALEAFVLEQVRGRSPVDEVAEATGLKLDDVIRVARRLVDLGALEVDDDGPTSKRSKAPVRSDWDPPPSSRLGATGLVPPAVIPVARRCPELRSLGIKPRDGFVLSQIDGATSTADLAEITHLSARDLSDALNALEAVGAIELSHLKRRPSNADAARPTKGPPSTRISKAPPSTRVSKAPPSTRVSKARPSTRVSKAPQPSMSAPEKIAVELPEADRVRIAEMAARIGPLDHYATLGVVRDADPKAIRRAYHALAAQFHPDRFFGKTLGPSRKPLDRIFARLSLAYDTLSKKGEREKYDATLPPRPAASAPAQKPPPVRLSTRRSMRAVRQPSTPAMRRAQTPAPAPAVTPPPVVPPARSASHPSAPDPLQRMYAAKKRSSVQEHVDVFVRAAKEALDRDDVVAAANSYRLAAQCSEDPAIRAALEETDARARIRVRDASLAGARAAEQAGRWGEAAAKYAKAHGTHAEAWIAERAAHALCREGTDLRRAAQLAEQAVLAEPHNVVYRVTLAEIYLDAGLMARAAGEAARALALAPTDSRARALSKRVAKGK